MATRLSFKSFFTILSTFIVLFLHGQVGLTSEYCSLENLIASHLKKSRELLKSSSEGNLVNVDVVRRAMSESMQLRRAIAVALNPEAVGRPCIETAKSALVEMHNLEEIAAFRAAKSLRVETRGDFSFAPLFFSSLGDWKSDLKELKNQLRDGDIFLSRGASLLSTLSAQFSDTPGHFSHLAMVKKVDGEILVMESDSNTGVEIKDLAEFLSGKHRISLFRYENSEKASMAAKAFYTDARSRKIPYDFSFDSRDHSALYCTELLPYSFSMVGEAKVPKYVSYSSAYGSSLGKFIGMGSGEILMPNDVELDSRFKNIFDWRSLAQTDRLNRNDAIVGKSIQWIGRDGYELLPPGHYVVASLVISMFQDKLKERLGFADISQAHINIFKLAKTALAYYSFLNVLEEKLSQKVPQSLESASMPGAYREALEEIFYQDYLELVTLRHQRGIGNEGDLSGYLNFWVLRPQGQ